jgi:hypothetical protein
MEYRIEEITLDNPQPIEVKGKRILFLADNFGNVVFNASIDEYGQNKIPHIKLKSGFIKKEKE